MKVFFIGYDDNANVGFHMMKAAEAAGCEVRGFKVLAHPVQYPEELPLRAREGSANARNQPLSWLENLEDLKWADVLHYYNTLNCNLHNRLDTPYVVQHGSNSYRMNTTEVADYYHDAKMFIAEEPDLLGFFPRETLLVPPLPEGLLAPFRKARTGPIKVGHLPSNPQAKGSPQICETLLDIEDGSFEWQVGGVDNIELWPQHMERKSAFDIYIETLQPYLDRYLFGEQGVSARESAFLGSVVITNSLRDYEYEKQYGSFPFQRANTTEELKERLLELVGLDREALQEINEGQQQWLRKHCSYAAVGKRLVEEVYT